MIFFREFTGSQIQGTIGAGAIFAGAFAPTLSIPANQLSGQLGSGVAVSGLQPCIDINIHVSVQDRHSVYRQITGVIVQLVYKCFRVNPYIWRSIP